MTTPEEGMAVPVEEVGEETRPELTQLILLRDQLQKIRIAEGNRVSAAVGLNDENRAEIHRHYEEALSQLEKSITKQVKDEIQSHPVWHWATQIRGVGETSLASVVGYIDIERADTISALWRYAGYGVQLVECPTCHGDDSPETCECAGAGVVGRRERPTKGEKLHYNARLKTMVWRLIDIQVKLRGPYRDVYDMAKFSYTNTRPSWTKGHIEAASRRKAAKMFLSHLWMVWREAEGLPTRVPYIEEHGEGQHDIIGPHQFLSEWKEKKEGETMAIPVEETEVATPIE